MTPVALPTDPFLILKLIFEVRYQDMTPVPLSVVLFVYLTLCGGAVGDDRGGMVLRNSIKGLSGSSGDANPSNTVSARPSVVASDRSGGRRRDSKTVLEGCALDADCKAGEFCSDSRAACLPCRKRRKRCQRDAMCCNGNRCSNGVCQPAEADAGRSVSKTGPIIGSEPVGTNLTAGSQPKRTALHYKPIRTDKGGEGAACLRSGDCADGLCCARHFWSRICKPVLQGGQVCTRQRRKGGQGLELFQRCDCAPGLACRTTRHVGLTHTPHAPHTPHTPRTPHTPHTPRTPPSTTHRTNRNLHTCQIR